MQRRWTTELELDPGASLPEQMEEILQRCDRAPAAVWITRCDRAAVLRRAEELRAAGPEGLPLFGVPFAIKDNIDAAGLPTTAACPAFAYLPKQSATVVRHLEAAGAILIGKTNLDQFATGLVGTRTPHGACGSVFDPEFVSGGSSSGSAVAVGARLVGFSLGTDTAGSGRVPAAFNGIVGLKPTRGRISCAGVVPACRSLDCISIFARSIDSAEAVLAVAGVPDPGDPFSREAAAAPGLPAAPVIGVPQPGQLEFFGDTEAARCFEAALERAEQLGAELRRIDYRPFAECAGLLYGGPWVAERYAAVGRFIKANPEACDPTVRGIILAGESIPATELFEGIYRLQELKRLAGAELEGMDFLMLPTAPTNYRIREVQADPVRLNARLGTYTNFVNLLDMSALAIPAGTKPDGFPFGVTLVGRAFADPMLAAFGRRFLGEEEAERTSHGWRLAVCGAHLSGQPLNGQLTGRGGKLVRSTRTAPAYRLYALPTDPPKPGLVRDTGGSPIEVEIWELPSEAAADFLAQIPPPLCIGSIELEDGSREQGFLCESYALAGTAEITSFGSWRRYLASLP